MFLNLRDGGADDGSMKPTTQYQRHDEPKPTDMMGSVRMFLEVSGAAREPVDPDSVRKRIVQDSLGALRDRLATA